MNIQHLINNNSSDPPTVAYVFPRRDLCPALQCHSLHYITLCYALLHSTVLTLMDHRLLIQLVVPLIIMTLFQATHLHTCKGPRQSPYIILGQCSVNPQPQAQVHWLYQSSCGAPVPSEAFYSTLGWVSGWARKGIGGCL